MANILDDIKLRNSVTVGDIDNGMVMRPWAGSSSSYMMIGTSSMGASEYSLLTDGTNTFISGGVGGYVSIRGGGNDVSPVLYVNNTYAYVDNGNFGIGTTTPSAKLHVGGSAVVNGTHRGGSLQVNDYNYNTDGIRVYGYSNNEILSLISRYDQADGGLFFKRGDNGLEATIGEINWVSNQLRLNATVGSLAIQTGNSTAITIDSSQRVGIGTNNPSAKLDITSTTGGQLRVGYNDLYGWNLEHEAATGAFTFKKETSEKFRISQNGNVGIGTTTAYSKLHINSTSGSSDIRLTEGNDSYGFILKSTGQNTDYAHLKPKTAGNPSVLRIMANTYDADAYLELWRRDYEVDGTNWVRGLVYMDSSNNMRIRPDSSGTYSSGSLFLGTDAYNSTVEIGNSGNVIISTGLPLILTGTGNGTYNKSTIYNNNSDGLLFEGAWATDATTTRNPITLTWRGGYGYGGLKLNGSTILSTNDNGFGIGVASADRGLTINRSNQYASLNIKNAFSGNQTIYLGTGSSGNDDIPILQMFDSTVEKIRLYTEGNSWITNNLGIGNTNPAYKLDVTGTIRSVSQGGFQNDNVDDFGYVNIGARLTGDSTFFGVINKQGHQCHAVNVGGSSSSGARGKIEYYTKTDGSWRMALAMNNGRVGIGGDGADDTAAALGVNGIGRFGSYAYIGTSTSYGYYQDANNGAYRAIGTDGNRGYYFQSYAGSSTTMMIGLTGAYAGRVGIGITSPPSPLAVKGAGGNGTIRIIPTAANGEASIGYYQDTTGTTSSTRWVAGVGGWGNTNKFTIGYGDGGADVIINTNGRMGLNEALPQTMLHITTSDGTRGIKVENTNSDSYSEVHLEADSREYRMGVGGSLASSDYRNAWYVYDNNAGAHRILVKSDGKVGISRNPNFPLDVNGFISTDSTSNTSGLLIRKSSSTIGYVGQSGGWEGNTSTNLGLSAESGNGIRFYVNGSASIVGAFDTAGKFGLGIASPLVKLEVYSGQALIGERTASGGGSYFYDSYSNGDSAYYHVPQVSIGMADASTGGIDEGNAQLLLHNPNGSNNTWVKLALGGREATGAGNTVSYAGIAARKISGTSGAWARGELHLWTKNNAIMYTGITISYNGNTSINYNCTIGGTLGVTGNISSNADVIAYASSDKRLKDNIKPIENAIDKVNKIGGYTFDWNDKQDTFEGNDVGVIAQEIEEVLPQLVTTRDNGYKAVKYEKLVALLIEGMKEQQQQIDMQQQQIDELKKLIK